MKSNQVLLAACSVLLVGVSLGAAPEDAQSAKGERVAHPAGSGGTASPLRPVDITGRPQLFVDDFVIERSEGVSRTLNRPEKVEQNPIMRPDRPWEGSLCMQPGTVIYDEQDRIFKMWYLTFASREKPDVEEFLCYATSRDGLHWERPDLNLVDYLGSKANNILLRWANWTHVVLKDPRDPDPSRRYKLAYWRWHEPGPQMGVRVAFSPDGIHWTEYPSNPVVPWPLSGDTFSVMQDPVSNQFWLYHKSEVVPVRKVARLVSDDFIHWREDRVVLEPDEFDPPDTEFYGLSAFPYGAQYLGLLWVFHTYPQWVDVQMVSSHDGLAWKRTAGRKIYLELGFMVLDYSGQSFDSGMVYPANAPVRAGNELFIYYSGFNKLHNLPDPDNHGAIGLAKTRVDGFCSLDATSTAFVETRPVRLHGASLFVNAEVRKAIDIEPGSTPPWEHLYNGSVNAQGSIRVEIEDESGAPLRGYEATRCQPIAGDGLDQKVNWEGGRDIGALRERTVRIKFLISRAKLYSFRTQ